jgi:hypothetical protein
VVAAAPGYRWAFEPHLPRRFPAAALVALGIVAAVELVFRAIPPQWIIPRESGEIEYYTSRYAIDAFGPAEVSIVGSSRAKAGIVLPELHASLRSRRGAPVTVANYSTAGARADESHAMVEYLLRAGRPRILLYGVTPRDLLGNEPRYARSSIFWSASDWMRAAREDRNGAMRVLPVFIRSIIGQHYYTLRYRHRPFALIEDFWRAAKLRRDGIARFSIVQILRGEPSPDPAFGGLTRGQQFDRNRSLVTHPISEEHVRLYVQGLLEYGQYPLGARRLEELRLTIDAAQRAGVPIVFFETPISDRLRRNKPPGTYDAFLGHMRALCDSTGTPFLEVGELGIQFDDRDFLEQSHLNLRGASRLTEALLDRAILPVMERR